MEVELPGLTFGLDVEVTEKDSSQVSGLNTWVGSCAIYFSGEKRG